MDAPEIPIAGGCRALTLRVRLFAGLREAMGWGERPLISAAGATPLAVWHQLALNEAWQGGGSAGASETPEAIAMALPAGIRVAINQRFADPLTPLADGDELAFLPPISGG